MFLLLFATALSSPSISSSAANVEVAKAYDALLLSHDQYSHCVGPKGVAPDAKNLRHHNKILAQIAKSARQHGYAAIINEADKTAPSKIAAVDTSCIIGPSGPVPAAINTYRRDLVASERRAEIAIHQRRKTAK